MATQAPTSKATLPSLKPKGRKGKPLHSVVARKPNLRIHGDVVASPRPAEETAKGTSVIVAAGKFKATCLQLLDAAAAGESITITKHGKAVARLVPPEVVEEKPFVPLLGRMKGKGKILGDIVSPDFEAWGLPDPRKKRK